MGRSHPEGRGACDRSPEMSTELRFTQLAPQRLLLAATVTGLSIPYLTLLFPLIKKMELLLMEAGTGAFLVSSNPDAC